LHSHLSNYIRRELSRPFSHHTITVNGSKCDQKNARILLSTWYTSGMKLKRIHHIAIIASDYEKSKKFYTEILGLEIVNEVYREERESYMLDLALNGEYMIELFSFPNPPKRPSYPEACGLRHLAFAVDNVADTLEELHSKGVKTTELRHDSQTGKPMAFFFDPDELPLELSQI